MADDVFRARQRLAKKRKKWHRRIAIAKACRKIHLTHVRNENGELWLSAEDIIDKIAEDKRTSISINEFTNRVRHLQSQDFVTTYNVDTFIPGGLRTTGKLIPTPRPIGKRYRRQLYRIDDIDLLDDYIASCEAAVLRIV